MSGLERLRVVMRIQAVVFALFGIGWFFIPGVIMDSLFSMPDVDVGWVRVLGGAFLGIAWLEWAVVQRLEDRVDLVWGFAFLPAIFLISTLWDKAAGSFTGTASFYWMVVVVTTLFAVLVSWARMGARS